MTDPNYDLHTHTRFSDGELTPTELLALAAERGVDYLGITDHDTVAAIEPAMALAQALNIQLVAGVEISSRWADMDIHVLGLAISHQCPLLLQRLQSQAERRFIRAQKICQRLYKDNAEQRYQDLLQQTEGRPPGRPDLANQLLREGQCRTFQEAFRKYLGVGKSAYVKTEWPDIAEVVSWILEAGGIPVLAHPSRYKVTNAKLKRLLVVFSEAGGQALEVVISSQEASKTAQLARLADEFGLCASCGSDFHSPNKVWAKLGALPPLPASCQPVWQMPAFNVL